MITKERLEELIEQGATIYWIYGKSIEKKTLKHKYHSFFICDNELNEYNAKQYIGIWKHKLSKLFETREEAEWHRYFGNITRTERLELPTWEEATDLVYSGSFGVQTIIKFDKCKFGYKLQLDGNVYIFVDKGTYTLFMGSLTKENYTLACRKCVELFLGEKK